MYAFVSPDRPDTTTLVANFLPFEEPAGRPNFYKFAQDARYEVNVDNDGDSLPESTYRFTFKDSYRDPNTFLYSTGPVRSLDDPNLNFRQTYDLTLIQRAAEARPCTGRTTIAPGTGMNTAPGTGMNTAPGTGMATATGISTGTGGGGWFWWGSPGG